MKENLAAAKAPTRRKLFFKIGIALNAIGGVLLTIPLFGYLFANFQKKHLIEGWVSLGPANNFPEAETRLATFQNPLSHPWDGKTSDLPCWVRHISNDKFQVFAINCAHLGCPVRWFAESQLFMCPCHGGIYNADGSLAAGPPPRGLFEYDNKIENGNLFIKGGILPTLSEPLS